MPTNSTGQLAIWRDASGADENPVNLSPQDSGVRLRDIQDPTTVNLPNVGEPNDGDDYEVQDADGSCSSGSPIAIVPPTGTTIRGASSLTLTAAFVTCRLIFDAIANDWTAEVSAPAAAVPTPARAWAQTTVELDDFATLHQVIVSVTVTPTVTGKFRVSLVMGAMATGSGGNNAVQVGISHGAGNPADDYTSPIELVLVSESSGNVIPTQIVDLDKIPSPIVFPIGTPVQINMTLTMGVDGATGASVDPGACIEVQEVF
jgi:hypothetical protein